MKATPVHAKPVVIGYDIYLSKEEAETILGEWGYTSPDTWSNIPYCVLMQKFANAIREQITNAS